MAWSHFLELIYLKDVLQRDFYAEMCGIERWSVRILRERIGSMLFERTALSRKPDELVRREIATLRAKGEVTEPLLLKDPYVLDFLGLDDSLDDLDQLPPPDVLQQEIIDHLEAALASFRDVAAGLPLTKGVPDNE